MEEDFRQPTNRSAHDRRAHSRSPPLPSLGLADQRGGPSPHGEFQKWTGTAMPAPRAAAPPLKPIRKTPPPQHAVPARAAVRHSPPANDAPPDPATAQPTLRHPLPSPRALPPKSPKTVAFAAPPDAAPLAPAPSSGPGDEGAASPGGHGRLEPLSGRRGSKAAEAAEAEAAEAEATVAEHEPPLRGAERAADSVADSAAPPKSPWGPLWRRDAESPGPPREGDADWTANRASVQMVDSPQPLPRPWSHSRPRPGRPLLTTPPPEPAARAVERGDDVASALGQAKEKRIVTKARTRDG